MESNIKLNLYAAHILKNIEIKIKMKLLNKCSSVNHLKSSSILIMQKKNNSKASEAVIGKNLEMIKGGMF